MSRFNDLASLLPISGLFRLAPSLSGSPGRGYPCLTATNLQAQCVLESGHARPRLRVFAESLLQALGFCRGNEQMIVFVADLKERR